MCETLKVDDVEIPKWRSILDLLPPYLINSDGALSEWAWPSLVERQDYEHRHSSGLMPLWPYREITAETNRVLWSAAKEFHRRKDLGHYPGVDADTQLSAGHGLIHSAFIATILNEPEFVSKKLVEFVARGYYCSALTSTHYENFQVFCADVMLSVPSILIESLIGSDSGLLELLPACPTGLGTGSIRGVLGRSRFRVDELKWDLGSGHVSVSLTSLVSQKLKVIHRGGITTFDTKAASTKDSPIQYTVDLLANDPTTITIIFAPKASAV
jgi:hypothetical protein